MVIKGSARGDAAGLAAHLLRTDENERVKVLELRGVLAEDLLGALLDLELVGSGTQSRRPFYHSSINTAPDEHLTDAQRDRAIERLEQELGLAGQPRAVVEHVKEGRQHYHIVWSRVDLDRMAMISDSHNYRKHEIVSRELEREFGHERVQGAHIEREGVERPERTPDNAEQRQAERSGLSPHDAKAWITALWRATDSGRAFTAALESHGWTLARGDRRDFVLLDPHGETHSLTRRIEGAKAAEVRARMADVDAGKLPSVEESRAVQKEREAERELATPATPILAPEPTADRARDSRTAPAPDAAQSREGGYQPTGQAEPTHHGSSERDRLLRDGSERTETAETAPAPAPEKETRAGEAEFAAAAREIERGERAAAFEESGASPAAQRDDHSAALAAHEMTAPARQAVDQATHVFGGILGGMARAVGKLFDFLADMIAPAPPPTPEQAERMERAAGEEQRLAEFREYVAQRDRELDTINEQQQAAREDEQRREGDFYSRFGSPLTRDADRERDDDYGGRERER